MTTDLQLPLVEGADGITDLTSWAVAIREDWHYIEALLENTRAASGNRLDERRAINVSVTLEHETVHFLQGLTMAFPFGASIHFFWLCAEVSRAARERRLTPVLLRDLRQTYENYWNQFLCPHDDISTVHLMEAMAVTESARAATSNLSPDGFHAWLASEFPDPSSVYRIVIDRVRKRLGDRAAYNLTPRLVFLSLAGDTPAQNFETILDRVSECPEVSDASTSDLCDFLEMPPKGLLAFSYHTRPDGYQHPLLEPYITKLADAAKSAPNALLEAISVPGARNRGPLGELFKQVMPPYIACSGGRAYKLGLASTWPTTDLFAFMGAHAELSAAHCLLTDGRPYQSCSHTECPVFTSALCHGMYPPSSAVATKACLFHSILSERFCSTADELVRIRTQAGATP